jgi:heme exporter protein A
MLEIKNLYFDYPNQSVLKDLSISVKPGMLLHLRGENGSGKTTLMKIVAGLLYPESGDVFCNGHSVKTNVSQYQSQLSFVGHKPGLSLLLTIKENCLYGLDILPLNKSLDDILHQFGLQGLENTPCHLLSAGQLRRAGLMKLALSSSPLWLLDEPMVSLDVPSIQLLITCMREHLENKGMIMMTSHQLVPLPNIDFKEYCL